jgi:hypothetical protein
VDDAIIHLRDPDPNTRERAASWLAGNGDPRAVDPLIEALKDENVMVRKYAAMSLGAIGDSRAVDPLIKALKDESSGVRSSASKALGAIGDRRAVDPLIEVLEDGDEAKTGVAWTASQALGEIIGATGQWESFTPDLTAFAAQPGNVFPLRYSPVKAGSYLFMIGPAGDNGLDLPPRSLKTVGPYELVGGHKYKLTICQGTADYSLRDFKEDPSDLLSYSDPSPGFASVYISSDPICEGRDMWYAICLSQIKPDTGKNAAEVGNCKFAFEKWGSYGCIDLDGKKYFGFYSSDDAGYPTLLKRSADTSLYDYQQISEVLIDDDSEGTLSSSDSNQLVLELREGYQLRLIRAEDDGNRVYVELTKNGKVIDQSVVGSNYKELSAPIYEGKNTYTYKNNIGKAKDIVQIAVNFKNAFQIYDGSYLATYEGVFQISESPIELEDDTSE